MNLGAWLLFLFIWTSMFYALAFLPSFMPQLRRLSDRLSPVRAVLAWINVPLGIGVAVHTGVMLGAMPARPLWNSPILALLFLISGKCARSAGQTYARLCGRLIGVNAKSAPGLQAYCTAHC